MVTPLKLISVVIFLVLGIGYLNRRHPKRHIPLMVTAFVADVLLVLYIELTRHAVETALGPTSGLMKVHITMSVLVVVLYVGQIITGIRKARSHQSRWHGVGGRGLLLFRFGNLVTSFLLPQ